jgi:membrane protease YdiL (CAAX protease family)
MTTQEGEQVPERGEVSYRVRIVLAAGLVAAFLPRLFLWLSAGGVPGQRLVLVAAEVLLLAVLPFAAAHRWPAVASFDKTLVRIGTGRLRAWGSLIGATVAICAAALAYALLRQVAGTPSSRPAAVGELMGAPLLIVIWGLLGVVLAPLAEEVFWRGWVLDQLGRFMGRKLALLVQSLLFCVLHFRYVGGSLGAFGYAAAWGWWRQRHRALIPLMVVHVAVNAIGMVPVLVTLRQDMPAWQAMDRTGIDLKSLFRQIERSQACREIDAIPARPMDKAVPRFMPFLGSDQEPVRLYAAARLETRYGKKASALYKQALLSEKNDRVVERLLGVVGFSGCRELIPDIRNVGMTSKDEAVQIAAVTALGDLGDSEGLRQMRKLPSETVRRLVGLELSNQQARPGAASPGAGAGSGGGP